MNVILPDGSGRSLEEGATVYDLAASIGSGLARDAIAGKVNGGAVDLSTVLADGDQVEILTTRSTEALDIMRHSAAHIMAEAVQELYPDAQIAFGPNTEDGFFYDFALDHSISVDDFEAIEEKVSEIIARDEPFIREVVSRDRAKEMFAHQRFKVEHIDDLAPDAQISVYRHGKFIDLCTGPHIPSAAKVGAFKLMKVAGAYWKGDASNEMLQRLYGTAFFKKKDLATYLTNLAEAEKRDHRKVGRELGYFMLDDDAGVGLPLYPPKGARVIRILQEWLRRDLYERGYEEVITPHVYKSDVWKTSGHYDFYGENMYFFTINEGSEDAPRISEYGVKPMNCPGHVLLYRNEIRSYRDLPLRLFEFGTVYRHELSGAVHGLLRARGFTQDDAHVFCTRDQVVSEVVAILDLVHHIMSTFDFSYTAEISTRPEKSIGSDEMWEHATNALKEACEQRDLEYDINEGDGAFYGPKIDIKVRDAIGRTWQCSTIQVDFNLPERFDLTYRTADNTEERPWMLHRAIFGSIERFFGILIEHYSGALPMWLAPIQVALLPLADRHLGAVEELAKKLKAVGGRVEIYGQNEPMRVKIAKAQNEKIPYMAIIGDKELEGGTVSIRERHEGDLGAWEIDRLIDVVSEAQL